jgi:hypothetical protein
VTEEEDELKLRLFVMDIFLCMEQSYDKGREEGTLSMCLSAICIKVCINELYCSSTDSF